MFHCDYCQALQSVLDYLHERYCSQSYWHYPRRTVSKKKKSMVEYAKRVSSVHYLFISPRFIIVQRNNACNVGTTQNVYATILGTVLQQVTLGLSNRISIDCPKTSSKMHIQNNKIKLLQQKVLSILHILLQI